MRAGYFIALVSLVLLSGIASSVQARTSTPLIQRTALDPVTGVLTITGADLSPELIVLIDGETVPLLPGATATQIEVQAPASVLQTPGTYRLTVVDRAGQVGDVFVVAHHQMATGAPNTNVVSMQGTAPQGRSVDVAGTPTAGPVIPVGLSTVATPSPFTVIEDSSSPYRTALGFQALLNNAGGLFNTAVGYTALKTNSTGSRNTSGGAGALVDNTTGSDNIAFGTAALANNTTASGNAAVGTSALQENITGFNNTANGYFSLLTNVSGDRNTAVGALSLENNKGDFNSGLGESALFGLTTGARNTALGYQAGYNATTGSSNVFLGADVRGTAADTNTMRLGLPYDTGTGLGQTQTFIAGIYGTTLSTLGQIVYIDANGQLGTLQPPLPPPAVGSGGRAASGDPKVLQAMQVRVDAQQATIAQLERQVHDQEKKNAELLARLTRLEALVSGKPGK